MSVFGSLRRLSKYLMLRPIVTIGALAVLVGGLILHALQPLLFGRAVDEVAQGRPQDIGDEAMLMVIIALTTWVLRWASTLLVAVAAQTAMRQLRQELFVKMQQLSLGFHERTSTGDLMARITSDTEVINTFLSTSLNGLISAVVQIVAVTILMLSLDLTMTVVVVLLAPVSLLVMGRIARVAAKNFAVVQSSVGAINGFLEENVTGQRTVQAYGRGAESLEQMTELSVAARDSDQKASFLAFTVMPLVRLVGNADVVAVALIGGVLVVNGNLGIGDVVAFLGYSSQFAMPIGQVGRSMNQAIQASAGSTRVFELLEEQPDIGDPPSAQGVDSVEGLVEFESVGFSYEPDTPILIDNTFAAQPGEMIGLIGPTGAGKSTIINLIGRFYDIDDGEIRLDAEPIINLKLDDLRLRAAVVLQTPFLFNESIMYNLRYGRDDATDGECISAAKEANAHRFIERLPRGYDTLLSEGGRNLSQGQRQLLTIARAVVAEPDVLILDEATSSVDTRTEREIQQAMRRLMRGRTSFVIAHRLSTVRHADKIIALDHGQIQEIGTHDELMSNEDFYYDLYMQQFSGA